MSRTVVSDLRGPCMHDSVWAIRVAGGPFGGYEVVPRCRCGERNPTGRTYGADGDSDEARARALGLLAVDVLGGKR